MLHDGFASDPGPLETEPAFAPRTTFGGTIVGSRSYGLATHTSTSKNHFPLSTVRSKPSVSGGTDVHTVIDVEADAEMVSPRNLLSNLVIDFGEPLKIPYDADSRRGDDDGGSSFNERDDKRSGAL